jgi:SAM-dependent methyltransferase
MIPFRFACPKCRTPLAKSHEGDKMQCPVDGSIYRCENGIWRFLTPERELYYQKFIEEYETIRKKEGRGQPDPSYYRSLPWRDLSGTFKNDWRIRAHSFDTFIKEFFIPQETNSKLPLKILDIGAGNCWLSNRLSERGHALASIDLMDNNFDGLGAHIYYDTALLPIQAEFDHLPFEAQQADLAIFNASFHYSAHFEDTLKEIMRVLTKEGQIVILDSPFYYNPASGEKMVREREERFTHLYGFPSNSIASENFLTFQRLTKLAAALRLRWKIIRPNYGLRWNLRFLKARLLGKREPAQFLIAVGQREATYKMALW